MNQSRGMPVRYARYFRRPLALVLCGLVGVVSGLPRVGCICPSGENCINCSQNEPVVALCDAAGLHTSSDCCCCAPQPVESSQNPGDQVAGSERCHCQKFVRQLVLSHSARGVLVGSPPVVNWIPGDTSSLDLVLVRTSRHFIHRDRLPPGGPVSRAQILRL